MSKLASSGTSPKSDFDKRDYDFRPCFSEEAAEPLEYVCFYEFARESEVMREWARVLGQAVSRRLEREFPVYFPFLRTLAPELAADTPWQAIEVDRRSEALKVPLFEAWEVSRFRAQQAAARLQELGAPALCSPTFYCPWPTRVGLAHDHDIGAGNLVTWESWADGRSRKGVEVVAFRIDWGCTTNDEVVAAVSFFRPEGFPELIEKTRNGSKKGARGKGRGVTYCRLLKGLGCLRIRREFTPKIAGLYERDIGVKRSGEARILRKRARDHFNVLFAGIDGGLARRAVRAGD